MDVFARGPVYVKPRLPSSATEILITNSRDSSSATPQGADIALAQSFWIAVVLAQRSLYSRKKDMKLHMKKLLLSAAFLFAGPVLAAPAPFGLEIGSSTLDDAKSQYKLEEVQREDGYRWFRLEGIEQDGLLIVLAVADRDSTIHSIVTLWRESDFDRLLTGLVKNYELVLNEISPDGNKSVVFMDGDTAIVLSKYRGKSRVGLSYSTNEYARRTSSTRPETERKRKSESRTVSESHTIRSEQRVLESDSFYYDQ